jgi:hypothetical protein
VQRSGDERDQERQNGAGRSGNCRFEVSAPPSKGRKQRFVVSKPKDQLTDSIKRDVEKKLQPKEQGARRLFQTCIAIEGMDENTDTH